MELHNLKPAKGSVGKKKRLGRGQGSTDGGTASRGHKGAKSRSGYKSKLGFGKIIHGTKLYWCVVTHVF